MKTLGILFLTVIAIMMLATGPVNGQSANSATKSNPEQWRSHQMNQPSPSASEKDKLSTDRLEEIKQLYMEAKRESEKKPASENKPVFPLNHQMK